ncbi:MAG TPA: hypothetical protein VEL76_35805, partial [Gemmataceae bacterium]|nr:hypothetical protein [Gemmataceae bacterium]
MSVFSFLRHVGRRHKESQRAKGAKKQRRGGERLRVEALEKRELLNNDTPFIKSVSPPDGGGSSSALPALT